MWKQETSPQQGHPTASPNSDRHSGPVCDSRSGMWQETSIVSTAQISAAEKFTVSSHLIPLLNLEIILIHNGVGESTQRDTGGD